MLKTMARRHGRFAASSTRGSILLFSRTSRGLTRADGPKRCSCTLVSLFHPFRHALHSHRNVEPQTCVLNLGPCRVRQCLHLSRSPAQSFRKRPDSKGVEELSYHSRVVSPDIGFGCICGQR